MLKVKDLDLLLLAKLKDKDLFHFSKTNKSIYKLCNDEKLWRTKFFKRFGKHEKSEARTWKDFYFQILHYPREINYAMAHASKGGWKNIDLIQYFISRGATRWPIFTAAKLGDKRLVDFFISQGATYWNWGMYHAARGGHRDLADFFILKGASHLNPGMYHATESEHRNLVNFFISKGADDWNTSLFIAAFNGHEELVHLFLSKEGVNRLEAKAGIYQAKNQGKAKPIHDKILKEI